jgi:RNA polymerase sigma-70 factor, ECF subfamily
MSVAAEPRIAPERRIARERRIAPERRIENDLERHRAALTRHCTRMLGSSTEAEDAVQETLLRAWRNHERFEGRSALGSWLYRIATNVCIDMLNGRSRRAVPVDPASLQSAPLHAGPETDPAERALGREHLRLALVTAVERLPPRQRAVLLLREVLCWSASEVAGLLDTSEAAVNSALQRARTGLDERRAGADGATFVAGAAGATSLAGEESYRKLLASYLAAFKPYQIAASNP